MIKDVPPEIEHIEIALAPDHARILERVLREERSRLRKTTGITWSDEAQVENNKRVVQLLLDQISQGLNGL